VSLELDLETAGVAAVTSAMVSGATTGVGLVEAYLDRIATLNPLVGSQTPFDVVVLPNGDTASTTNPSYTLSAILPAYTPFGGSAPPSPQ